MYRLEKLSINEGEYSVVKEGHTQTSDKLMVFLAGEHPAKEIKDINKIKLGWQILVAKSLGGYLQTSPVQEILETGEDFVRFRTMTSTYELTKI